ncbi:MATE family efflux transporter [Miniimonas sp. S16]|uniref:MATE family efflux transporter n=1 Tax=Miniimonas sp. S16 TaxID=2171623 RepID=UPI000D5270C2|nr:MATE family efflux transporter [Miniimonas sp. S16]
MPADLTTPAVTNADDASEGTASGSTSGNRRALATAPVWRALVHLCVPMIAGLSVGTVYNIVNAGFVGSLHSTPMLAALTLAMPVFAVLMAVGGVFGVGGGTYVSRLIGAEDAVDPVGGTDPLRSPAETALRIKQLSAFTLWGAVAAGVVVGVVGLVLATPIATAVGASGDALVPTAQYIAAMCAFAPAMVASFALEQLVRAEGAAVSSMTGVLISTAANFAFDVLFILVLHQGVLGAGIAVGLSNVVMAGYYVWWLVRRSEAAALAPRWLRLDRELLRTVFGVGVSELLQSSFLVVSTVVMNWVAIGYGSALLAGMGVALRISQLPEMICMGVFLGAIPLFAYGYGAGDGVRLRRAITGAAVAILGFTAVFSTLVLLFREQVFALFSADADVLADGTRILTAMLVATVFNGISGLVIAVFQATGQMRDAAIMSVAQGVLFVPVVLLGNAWFGMTGVIWAMTVTELVVFLLGAVLFVAARREFAGVAESGAAVETGADVLDAALATA